LIGVGELKDMVNNSSNSVMEQSQRFVTYRISEIQHYLQICAKERKSIEQTSRPQVYIGEIR